MIKKGVITKEISMDFEHALEVMDELGYEYAEIDSLWDKHADKLENSEIIKVKELLKKYNKKVCCIAPGLFERVPLLSSPGEISPFGSYEEHIEKLKKTIELANTLNANLIKVFGFGMEFWDEGFRHMGAVKCDIGNAGVSIKHGKGVIETVAERFDKPAEMAKKAGITLVIETCFLNNVSTAYIAKKVIEELKSDNLRVCWDPANTLYFKENPFPDGYELIKDYIAHVHIKDGIFEASKLSVRLCAPGDGDVKKYPEIIKTLVEDGYNGVFSLEPEYAPEGGTNEDGFRESDKGFKRILNEINLK